MGLGHCRRLGVRQAKVYESEPDNVDPAQINDTSKPSKLREILSQNIKLNYATKRSLTAIRLRLLFQPHLEYLLLGGFWRSSAIWLVF